ncbi:MAG: N-6 DNA methylase [Anaerobiospirillum sp.]|nr:N-6 DNA methylase [Anaerobiospirillum sp.]
MRAQDQVKLTELNKKLWDMVTVLSVCGIGTTDYLTALTYIIFLKMDQELDDFGLSSRLPPHCRWNALVHPEHPVSAEEMLDHYEEILATLSADTYPDALVRNIFAQAQNKITQPLYLAKVIALIDSEDWFDLGHDIKGALYEGLLAKIGQDQKNNNSGQYFTPRPLMQTLVELIDPQIDEVVWDPTCGTGGFLLAAFSHMSKQTLDTDKLKRLIECGIHGQDNTPLVVTMAAMNMFLHGFEGKVSPITLGDSLLGLPETLADVVLCSPPFGDRAIGSIPIERADFITHTNNNQLNFLQHIMSLLKYGGRAAVIMPENALFDKEGSAIRKTLLTKFNLHTILRLPWNLFYVDRINLYVLFFTKGEATTDVWYYDLWTGKKFTPTLHPITCSDFADFVQCYRATSSGHYGPREPTYDVKSNPNGRWRKFEVDYFLSSDYCRLNVPSWMETPKNAIEQMDLPQLLEFTQQRLTTLQNAYEYLQQALGPKKE